METAKLKKFAQFARRSLLEQVSSKLALVLDGNSAARRENIEAVKELEEAIKNHGRERIIEQVAYVWFNRFCALRFMDVNRYTRIGVLSPAEGQFQPEILAEAKMGHIDEEMVQDKVRNRIFALLDGKTPSQDAQGEAYRLLVVASCNFWNRVMPFLFQRIDDYTELLLPDDLLSGNSILAYTREAMTPDACRDVEVIGWLYQFYISEKKDEVFDGLKRNRKITPENIPAATQLFTPHWIVRYLVENSLGRLWLRNRPDSALAEKMRYYIKPEEPETDFLRIETPEEIKVCDPACGSGHMLTYAFDLLYAIYEEEGYEPADIPEKILTNNLYGIEIDERAGGLAAFALTMKARARQRRFFNRGIKPNICVLENIHFDEGELESYMDDMGRDLFTGPIQTTLRQFEEAVNLGSLIRPEAADVDGILGILEAKNISGQLFVGLTHQKALHALRCARYLGAKYHVVVTNPPYMGAKGMNGSLKAFLTHSYPLGKADLMACFMERSQELAHEGGFWGMINLPSWMFLQSFADLRFSLLQRAKIDTLLHLGRGIFGADFGSTAFTMFKPRGNAADEAIRQKGTYKKLFDRSSIVRTPEEIRELFFAVPGQTYTISQNSFMGIPGSPVVYWFNDPELSIFDSNKSLDAFYDVRQGIATADNGRFLRLWHELPITNIGFGMKSRDEAKQSGRRWFPYNKGGSFRKWYGNQDNVIDWKNDGEELFANRPTSVLRSPGKYFCPSASWSKVTIGGFSLRYFPEGFLFDVAGCSIFTKGAMPLYAALGALNSPVMTTLYRALMPTVNYEVGQVSKFPFTDKIVESETVRSLVEQSKADWDAYEIPWDFTGMPLLNPDCRQPSLEAAYQRLRAHWREMAMETQRLERENNRAFINAYGLENELPPDVPLNEVTLTCNPHYRYGNDKSEDELERLLLADTMRELVSYAVGCMFGRYSLDRPGLILANQGETIEDYRKLVPESRFPADADNVIPMLDGDWFTDDITEHFRKFLRVAFGDAQYEENLRFVEQALNTRGKRNYGIRDYFLGEFYADHVKCYKKRPIYWLFSSPKGSFNALIYMHRYRPDTVSVVLNDYLREFRTKLASHKNRLEAISISAGSSQGEKTSALKEIEKIVKMIAETEEYEREILYPLATKQVEIDLNDGVRANYPKLGAALKKIVGLETKEDQGAPH